jgi:hypothetical protein
MIHLVYRQTPPQNAAIDSSQRPSESSEDRFLRQPRSTHVPSRPFNHAIPQHLPDWPTGKVITKRQNAAAWWCFPSLDWPRTPRNATTRERANGGEVERKRKRKLPRCLKPSSPKADITPNASIANTACPRQQADDAITSKKWKNWHGYQECGKMPDEIPKRPSRDAFETVHT